MSAREKLNMAAFNGSLIIAGALGVLAQSWPLFWGVFCLLIVSNLVTGGIRVKRK
ncbi:MAG TPA: hypothetical protein VNQ76_19785 [Planctomicrobium sp.]|nr:hypothetical protein [Planctomicrobium sp.]